MALFLYDDCNFVKIFGPQRSIGVYVEKSYCILLVGGDVSGAEKSSGKRSERRLSVSPMHAAENFKSNKTDRVMLFNLSRIFLLYNHESEISLTDAFTDSGQLSVLYYG